MSAAEEQIAAERKQGLQETMMYIRRIQQLEREGVRAHRLLRELQEKYDAQSVELEAIKMLKYDSSI